jgi:hypothetical protein
MDFVTRTLDQSYAEAERDKQVNPGRPLSEQGFGDRFYESCMAGHKP